MDNTKAQKRSVHTLGRRTMAVLLAVALVLGMAPAVSPVRVQAAGVHSHDMSVECGMDDSLDYIPLTGDEDGKLYVNGTEAEIKTDSYTFYYLPEGNYYLAENITINNPIIQDLYSLRTSKDGTVNLCLNGKTLSTNGISMDTGGTLCLCDCGKGGRITAGDGSIVLQSSLYGRFFMYGGCLEHTGETKGENAVIRMVNYDTKAEIHGGTIKSNGGVGISCGDLSDFSLQISGAPEFVGNTIDVDSDVILYLRDLNIDRSEKIKVSRDSDIAVGESAQLDSISSLDGVDYTAILTGKGGQYFTYEDGQYYVNKAGIKEQPTKEKVSVNVFPEEGQTYQWYEAVRKDVTADRTIQPLFGMATAFTLQVRDTIDFTLPENVGEVEWVALGGLESNSFVELSSLGEGRYMGTVVETDDNFLIIYLPQGASREEYLLFEEPTYNVVADTPGEAISEQTMNTLTKAAAGRYMCQVTWEDLGYSVNSEVVELTEDIDACWMLDTDGKLTITSDDGMSNWIENRDTNKELVRTVELQAGVNNIMDSAFYGCSNLTEITMPDSVTGIGDDAFNGCSNLTEITIPDSVTAIGDAAFKDCTSLTNVTMLGEIPPTLSGSDVFAGCSFVAEGAKGIFVPVGKADDYKDAWSDYAAYITDGCPEIVTQPTNQSVKNGEQATFSVMAEGVLQPFTYQWQVNENGTEESGFHDIADATSDTYTITVDKSFDGYHYRCVVTNERGSVASSALELTVTASDADKVAAAKAIVQEVLADYSATNGSTKEDIQSKVDTALSKAGIEDVTVTVGELTKAEATQSEEGSISGSISIACGSETDSVAIDMTIETLPASDADKVAAAKAVVQEVLADYSATNGSTKEDIQNKIDTALSKAGIEDVTVTVGELTKTEATESEEGSIGGSISIACGSETDSVAMNKIIPATGGGSQPSEPDNTGKTDTPSTPTEQPGTSNTPAEQPGETSNTPADTSTEKSDDTVLPVISEEEQEKNALSLNAELKVSQTGKKINIEWGKVTGADGYDVYVQYCGKKFTQQSITAVKNGKTTKVTVQKINGKTLDLKKNYKIYVLAYKLVDGKKVTLGKTVTAHIIGRKNTKYTNVKAVKVKKSSYSLKKGKTAKIKASTVLVSPGKKQLTNAHAKQFRYASTDKKVATVSAKGRIKAVGEGKCIIYVYARNGYAKKVKVTVK